MTKPAKKRIDLSQDEDWHYCNPCQLKRGGKLPKNWVGTVTAGICSICKRKKTLIPTSDYNFPGRKAIWD